MNTAVTTATKPMIATTTAANVRRDSFHNDHHAGATYASHRWNGADDDRDCLDHAAFEAGPPYGLMVLDQLGWKRHAEDWGVAIDIAIDQVAALVTESGWAHHLERTD